MKRSRWQLAIPILIGLAIVPFSIREVYTQDEGGLEVMELVEDEKKSDPIPEQQTSPSNSVDADNSEIFEYKEVEVEPHPIDIVTPVYPEEARKEKIEGKVILQIVVNVDGSMSDVSVLEGSEVFHQAVIDAALQFRFRPGEHNGKAVPVRMIMPIEFSLDSTDTDPQLTSPVPIDADGNEVEIPRFFEVEAPPELLQSVKSVYPPGVTVRLELKVNVDGSVSIVKVLNGPEEFHQAAIDAISQYRFKPGTLNGKVVPVRMTQSIIFRLPKE